MEKSQTIILKVKNVKNKKKMHKYFLLTTDVETTSIINHRLSDTTGKKVADEAIPQLLDFYKMHSIKSTFFITGYFAEKFPYAVQNIHQSGHEIGCHGYSHKREDAFDMLGFHEQLAHLEKAKKILEEITSEKVISFRAPALRTNEFTAKSLEKNGFKIDSSVSSQRFDFFMSEGAKQKFQWLFSSRLPYFTSRTNLARKGDSSILEIPVSAIIMPYIGTTMRIFPNLIKLLRVFLDWEAQKQGNCINFLFHPNEMIIEDKLNSVQKNKKGNYLQYVLRSIMLNGQIF